MRSITTQDAANHNDVARHTHVCHSLELVGKAAQVRHSIGCDIFMLLLIQSIGELARLYAEECQLRGITSGYVSDVRMASRKRLQ